MGMGSSLWTVSPPSSESSAQVISPSLHFFSTHFFLTLGSLVHTTRHPWNHELSNVSSNPRPHLTTTFSHFSFTFNSLKHWQFGNNHLHGTSQVPPILISMTPSGFNPLGVSLLTPLQSSSNLGTGGSSIHKPRILPQPCTFLIIRLLWSNPLILTANRTKYQFIILAFEVFHVTLHNPSISNQAVGLLRGPHLFYQNFIPISKSS